MAQTSRSSPAIGGAVPTQCAVVIDVGVNRVEAPERKSGYRLVGDVDCGPVRKRRGRSHRCRAASAR